MLAIEVALLTGRYVATAFDDRNRAEWPPHPARLFSALVATHFEALEPSSEERAVLVWLERQGPPAITASEAAEREIATVFVPVNDTSVIGSFDDEAGAVDEARAAVEAAPAESKGRTVVEKKLAKAEARFAEAVRKAIAPVMAGKEGKGGPSRAASLLPERRIRQPRTFPSVTPVDPRVVFAWPSADPSAAQRAAIDALARRVVRLGHSSSLVTVRLRDDVCAPTWIPDEIGEVRGSDFARMLRVVCAGQTEALCAAFSLQPDTPGRVMPAMFQRYVRPDDRARLWASATNFGEEWIILRRIDGPRLPSTRAVDVARTVRKALLAAYGRDAPEILSGHGAVGSPSQHAHLAYVPLPFVAHDRADGSILGVALILPREASRDARKAVYRALDSWQKGARARAGDADAVSLPVHLGRAGILHLEALDDLATQSTLRAATWCGVTDKHGEAVACTSWASATPVALDRNPGELRASDPKKEAAAYTQAEETIAVACEHIGLPRPKSVTVLPAAPLAGADKARRFPAFQAGRPPVQRVLVHARLEFHAPVRGPILIGAGRYFGLGLFRPLRNHG